MEPLAYSIPEAAKVAGISRREMERRVAAGDIVVARVGRRVLIRRERLDEWLTAHEAEVA